MPPKRVRETAPPRLPAELAPARAKKSRVVEPEPPAPEPPAPEPLAPEPPAPEPPAPEPPAPKKRASRTRKTAAADSVLIDTTLPVFPESTVSQTARPGQETSGNFLDTMNVLSTGFDLRTGQAPTAPPSAEHILDDCFLGSTLPTAERPGGPRAPTRAQVRREAAREILEQRESIPVEVINYTRTTLMSWEDIRKGVCLVTIPSAEPVENTVNDPRMGPLTTGLCSSCHRDLTHCPSHDGYIEFARKMYHPLFMKEIILVLSCINLGCGRLRLSDYSIRANNLHKMSGLTCLTLFAKLSEKEGYCPCDTCKSSQEFVFNIPASKKRQDVIFHVNKKSKVEHVLGIEEVFRLFSQLTPKEINLLGFVHGAHPVDMIMQGMVVVGPAARPPTIENGELLNNHLTSMYIDIVKLNNQLSEPNLGEVEREKLYERLRFNVAHFINNTDGKYSHGHSAPYKSIQQSLQGKEELRGQSMGKRVENSSRTVIGPDLTLEFGQVSVPEAFEDALSTPVLVYVHNLDEIRRQWREQDSPIIAITSNHPKHPSRGIKREVNDTIRAKEVPQIGDVVIRKLQDGELIINNRQPTLHSLGMRAFRAKKRKAKSVGLVIEDTKPFNADFDGDEMNQHKPQSYEAIAEAMLIANATECIMNGQNDTPAVGFKLDVVSAFYQMTLTDQPVDKIDFFDSVMHITGLDLVDLEARAAKYSMSLFTTRVLASASFPRDFYYVKDKVRVENGILLSGALTNDHVGPSSRSIIQYIWKRYGKDRTVQWLTEARRLALRWARDRPITFGVAECLPLNREAHQNAIRRSVEGAKLKVEALGAPPDAAKDPLAAQKYEEQVRGYLNIAGEVGKAVAQHYDPDNPLFVMTKSGAKGNASNVSQISSLIGQQYLRGERLLPKTRGGRTLSYYDAEETNDLEAYGFINSSFLEGLNGPQYFMLMMAGREGLVDTGTTTATVGASNHAVIKACEDLQVAQDGSVRNASNMIIQPFYGYTGLAGKARIRTQVGTSTDEQRVSEETVATFVELKSEIGHLNSKAIAVFG